MLINALPSNTGIAISVYLAGRAAKTSSRPGFQAPVAVSTWEAAEDCLSPGHRRESSSCARLATGSPTLIIPSSGIA